MMMMNFFFVVKVWTVLKYTGVKETCSIGKWASSSFYHYSTLCWIQFLVSRSVAGSPAITYHFSPDYQMHGIVSTTRFETREHITIEFVVRYVFSLFFCRRCSFPPLPLLLLLFSKHVVENVREYRATISEATEQIWIPINACNSWTP